MHVKTLKNGPWLGPPAHKGGFELRRAVEPVDCFCVWPVSKQGRALAFCSFGELYVLNPEGLNALVFNGYCNCQRHEDDQGHTGWDFVRDN